GRPDPPARASGSAGTRNSDWERNPPWLARSFRRARWTRRPARWTRRPARSPQEHPHSDRDQRQRPHSVEPEEVKHAHVAEQEQHAQADQDDGASGHFGSVDLLSGTEGARQPKGIGRRFASLQGLRRAVCVYDLVNVEEGDTNTEDRFQSSARVRSTPNQEGKDQQVRQPLRVLPGVNLAYTEGKECGQHRGQARAGG